MADAAREPLEEPHVADGRRERDMSETLAADFGLCDFDAALVADDAAVLHALVLAAQALPIGDRTEDLRAEQAVAFRLEGPVVDRLRLGDFAVRPRLDLFRRREADADRVEIASESRTLVKAWSHMALYLFQYGLRSNLRGLLLCLNQLHIKTEGLQLANEHVERFGQARGERRVAFHNRLVDLRAPGHVVGLRGEEFLKDVRRAVRFER